MGRRKMKDNDLYSWSWKEGACNKNDPYWCKSRMAIVRDGNLYDTFWHDCRDGLKRKWVKIKFLGNIDEMTKISEYDKVYYRYQDIVDTSHSNNSRAPVYIKPNVTRNKKVILELLQYRKEKNERDIGYAQRKLKDLEDQHLLVDAGSLDEVWVPCED